LLSQGVQAWRSIEQLWRLSPVSRVKMKRPILIVDDDLSIRDMLQELLEEQGYDIQVARTEAEALACVRQTCPALVLLDLRLPQHNGTHLPTLLREEQPGLPLLVMSASPEVQGLSKRLGGSEFVTKPFDMDALLAAIKRLMAT
jgi:DNA-binding response OmpR family regulator